MKSGQTKLAALFCVGLALSFAFWNRTDSSRDGKAIITGDRIDQTKPYPRDLMERQMRTKNPREEFDAARKRGLTDQQVQSIVEEHLKATAYEDQPDRSIKAVMQELREIRWNMYLDAMVEAFQLTEAQIIAAQTKLPSLAAKDIERCLLLGSVDRSWQSSIENGISNNVHAIYPDDMTRAEKIEIMLTYPLYYGAEGTRPWDLCELNESQKDMLGFKNHAGVWTWVDGERTLDFGTSEHYADLSNPFATHTSIMQTAGKVFPLSMRQVDRLGDFEDESVSPHTPKIYDGGNLDRVKFLTRPQLKTLLLLRPETANKLKLELAD